jgi:hypothetical protein
MATRQNAKLRKCQAGKMSKGQNGSWWNVKLTKCQVYEMAS